MLRGILAAQPWQPIRVGEDACGFPVLPAVSALLELQQPYAAQPRNAHCSTQAPNQRRERVFPETKSTVLGGPLRNGERDLGVHVGLRKVRVVAVLLGMSW